MRFENVLYVGKLEFDCRKPKIGVEFPSESNTFQSTIEHIRDSNS